MSKETIVAKVKEALVLAEKENLGILVMMSYPDSADIETLLINSNPPIRHMQVLQAYIANGFNIDAMIRYILCETEITAEAIKESLALTMISQAESK